MCNSTLLDYVVKVPHYVETLTLSSEWEWVSEYGLTSPSACYRSFLRRVFSVSHLHCPLAWYSTRRFANYCARQDKALVLTTKPEHQNSQETEHVQKMQRNQSAAQNTLKRNLGYERGQTEPDLVAFYDIRPGNRASLFLSTWRP